MSYKLPRQMLLTRVFGARGFHGLIVEKGNIQDIKAAPSTGISISIGPIPAFFDGIGIGKACYTSANSVVGTSYVLLQ